MRFVRMMSLKIFFCTYVKNLGKFEDLVFLRKLCAIYNIQ